MHLTQVAACWVSECGGLGLAGLASALILSEQRWQMKTLDWGNRTVVFDVSAARERRIVPAQHVTETAHLQHL